MAMTWRSLIRNLAIRTMLAREWWRSGVTYNPLSPPVYRNPYPKYAELREKDPVHWSPLMDAWVLSRYEDIDAVLRDHKRFSNDARNRIPSRSRRASIPAGNDPSMLFLDPPHHTRLRALVSKAFTPPAIEALAPRIRHIMSDLLDQIPNPQRFDLMQAIANPLPVIVIAELLGVSPADREQFKIWSDRRARLLEPTMTRQERQAAASAGEDINAYFLEVIEQRRRQPRDDLISALVGVENAGDKLTQHELLEMLRLILIAGNETTTNLIGNGMLALLQHPQQMQKLRAAPDLITPAVEELLRYDPPVQINARSATQDMTLHGRPIRKGQGMILLIASANHDASVFKQPEVLDITRQASAHMAFGRGIHYCLGAPLARLEARIAIGMLLQRFATLDCLTDHPTFRDNVVLRGLVALPICAQAAPPEPSRKV